MINLISACIVLCGAVSAVILASLAAVLWRTWWLYPAWAWFIMPLGVRWISFWHFAGLLMFITVITVHIDTKDDDRKVSKAAVVVSGLWPVLAWVVMRWLK